MQTIHDFFFGTVYMSWRRWLESVQAAASTHLYKTGMACESFSTLTRSSHTIPHSQTTNYHGVRDNLVICASGSSSLMLAVLPMDFWLSIRATEFRSLCAWDWDPLPDWLPPIVFSSSDKSAFTRTSKRRFAVGYLDIDFVIPCNLAATAEWKYRLVNVPVCILHQNKGWRGGRRRYLRENASISAFLRSVKDGTWGREPFRRLGSPDNSTRIFRYSSSSSVRFSALICSFITISGSKNQSKMVFLGLLSDVISEPPPAFFFPKQVKLES